MPKLVPTSHTSKGKEVDVPENPIFQLLSVVPQLYIKSFQVKWDVDKLGVDNKNFPLYIEHTDAVEIAVGNQCLNIAVLQFWTM